MTVVSRKGHFEGVCLIAIARVGCLIVHVERLQTDRPVETVSVSTTGAGNVAGRTKVSVGALAVLKIAIVQSPEIAVLGLFVIFDSQHALSTILALQDAFGDVSGVEFAMRTAVSRRTLAGMRFGFESLDAGSVVGAKDVRGGVVSTRLRSGNFAIFSNVGNVVMLGVGAIAKEVFCRDLGVESVQAFASVITVMLLSASASTSASTCCSTWIIANLHLAGATKSRPVVVAFAVPAFPVQVLVKTKWQTVHVGGMLTVIGVSQDARGSMVATQRTSLGLRQDRRRSCCHGRGEQEQPTQFHDDDDDDDDDNDVIRMQ